MCAYAAHSGLKLLLFGFGNPGRGDDALGPMLVEHIEQREFENVVCQTDMQLQVEHVTDLVDCDRVMFVDADMSCSEPFELSEIVAAKDDSYTSHAMTPSALLQAYLQVYGTVPPQAYLLRIRGYYFALGDALSAHAADNLNEAINYMRDFCTETCGNQRIV